MPSSAPATPDSWVVKRLFRRLFDEIGDDGVFDAAAGVAFWLLLSMPAALLTALSAVSLLGDDLTDTLRDSMFDFIDRVFTDQADTLRTSVDSLFVDTRPGLLSISIAVAVFTVSRGFAGLIRALDTVYDVPETRNFIRTRLLGIGLAIGTLIVVAGSTALWALSADQGVPMPLRLVVALVVLIGWASMMYHYAPNHHTPWRYDLPGAALTAVGWFALSAGFGWYVSLVGDGNQFVGATGAVLLGLTWLWGACVVFLVGGELNQLIAERADVITRRDPLDRRATDFARSLASNGDADEGRETRGAREPDERG